MFACAPHTDMQMADEIPRWWDPGSKGSLSGVRSGRRGNHGKGCGGGMAASYRWAQGERLGARWWWRNWGIRRNRGSCRARRGSKETKSPVAWAWWGERAPRRGDRVRTITLGDGHGGSWRIESMSRSISGRWAGWDNKLWGRGGRRCRRCSRGGKRWGGPLGCIQSHWVRATTPIQTVDNIDEMMIGKTHSAEN